MKHGFQPLPNDPHLCGALMNCGLPADHFIHDLGTPYTGEPLVKNAVTCSICQSPADRYPNLFHCQANPNHVGDLMVGVFSDLTFPERVTEQ